MPLLGNLSEFPLPEVLLLIGARTGRLRLLDVPEFGYMDIDFSNGEAQALYIGRDTLTESEDMIAKLSAVIQSQGGMFEFSMHPVASVRRQRPLMINQMVMSLVCFVDEQVASRRAPSSPEHCYMLEEPQPEIWIEPELNLFFLAARPRLVMGANLNDLAEHLGMDPGAVQENLTNLRLLGLIKILDLSDTAEIKELDLQSQISRKSNDFLRASRVTTELARISSSLPVIKG